MSRNSLKNNTLSLARGAIFSALGVMVLLPAQPFEVLDLTLATLASLLVWFFASEYGTKSALCVYLTTALLSLILTPANTGAIVYAFVLGWFPLLKRFLEQRIRKKFLHKITEISAFTLCFLAVVLLFFKSFVGDMDFSYLVEDISFLISNQNGEILQALENFLNQKIIGLNLIQWSMIGVYLFFAPVFVLLYDLLLDKWSLFYTAKIRPFLVRHKFL